MSLTIHLLRHGDTGNESPRRFLGQRDIPLSGKGRDQARAWHDCLSAVDYAGAYCSDLARCRKTAEIILEGRDIAALPLRGLREISLGEWDGLTSAEVMEHFPGQYEARGADMAGYRPPGGESFKDVSDRAWHTLSAAIAPHASREDAVLLVVAHAGVNRCILCRLLGIPLERLFSLGQDHGCLNIIGLGSPPPVVRALNLPPSDYSSPYSSILR